MGFWAFQKTELWGDGERGKVGVRQREGRREQYRRLGKEKACPYLILTWIQEKKYANCGS